MFSVASTIGTTFCSAQVVHIVKLKKTANYLEKRYLELLLIMAAHAAGSVRQLYSRSLCRAFPPVECAFAYGSAVFQQQGRAMVVLERTLQPDFSIAFIAVYYFCVTLSHRVRCWIWCLW